MISIILAVLAIYIFFKKKISLSQNYEICRPKTYYFALIIVGVILAIEIFSRTASTFSTFLYILLILIPVVSAVFFKQRKTDLDHQLVVKNLKKIENKIAWFILIAIAVFSVGLYIYDLLK